jgi:hypothetical protein
MHLALLLPFNMTARHILETGVVDVLKQQPWVSKLSVITNFTVRTNDRKTYVPLLRPWRYDEKRLWNPRRFIADTWYVIGCGIHLCLVHRFNAICGFRGFRDRLRQSWPLRRQEIKEGHPSSTFFGFPYPRSKRLYNFMLRFYYYAFAAHPDVEAWFEQEKPDGLVIGHMQNAKTLPYVGAAKRRGLPIVGLNGSWDQPTSKGPIVPFDGVIAVQNQQTEQDIMAFHGIAPERIHVCGWPQMDHLAHVSTFVSRESFLRSVGLPVAAKYILFGAYSGRLGPHEPDLLATLLQDIQHNRLGNDVWLYIRCHPLDKNWQERFLFLQDQARVIVEPPSMGDLNHLANLLKHAGVVVASAGTIALEAVALDIPAIALAYEDETLPYMDRPARRYEMEHYAVAMATGGMWKATTSKDLLQAVENYLHNPSLHAEERRILRERLLEPLDGKAATRIVEVIAKIRPGQHGA